MKYKSQNIKKVLFICEGNVGRSQMAEAFYNYYSKNKLAISAGINDVGKKYNFVPRDDIIKVMQEKGIDLRTQRIKHLSSEHLIDIDSVIVLCKQDLLPQFVKDSKKELVFREIADPFKMNYKSLQEIRDTIETIVLEYLDK